MLWIAFEPEGIRPAREYPLAASGQDYESLLVNWLSEVLYSGAAPFHSMRIRPPRRPSSSSTHSEKFVASGAIGSTNAGDAPGRPAAGRGSLFFSERPGACPR